MTIEITTWESLDEPARRTLLERPALDSDREVRDRVRAIIREVRSEGDRALRRLTEELDGAAIEDFAVGEQEFADAEGALSAAELDAIDLAIRNVRRFHEAQLPVPLTVETMPGVVCERINHPIDAVGLYVPAGTAPLPSTAIMLCVPAAIAECPVRVLCTPPTSDGRADPAVLAAARRSGVERIFKAGGAQAIAAMAYGTESLPKVDRIFGPGNAWVTAAKTIVAADPSGAAIDLPAGPSEVLVIADADADPTFVAADLLSQAEHDTDSQVVLITTDDALASDVIAEIDAQLGRLGRRDIAMQAIRNSRFIVAASLATALEISNRYAPEHLILQIDEPRRVLGDVRNAGSVFLGPWSPESAGDYCSGTNHVLPTYGHARGCSGLGVDHFMRQMTVQELSRDGLQGIADAVVRLASLEGLDAHAAAVRYRLNGPDGSNRGGDGR